MNEGGVSEGGTSANMMSAHLVRRSDFRPRNLPVQLNARMAARCTGLHSDMPHVLKEIAPSAMHYRSSNSAWKVFCRDPKLHHPFHMHTHAHARAHTHASTVLAWHGTAHAHAQCIRRILPSKKRKSAIFLSGPRMEPVFARNPSAVCACPCRHSIWSFRPLLTICFARTAPNGPGMLECYQPKQALCKR
jgi:hypothetical protein